MPSYPGRAQQSTENPLNGGSAEPSVVHAWHGHVEVEEEGGANSLARVSSTSSLKPARRAPDPDPIEETQLVSVSSSSSSSPRLAPSAPSQSLSKRCSAASLKGVIAVLSFLVVGLAVVLGYVMLVDRSADSQRHAGQMESAPSKTDVANTRTYFSAGEEDPVLGSKDNSKRRVTPAADISSGHIQRFDAVYPAAESHLGDRSVGITRLMSQDDPNKVLYESSFEIVDRGIATLGEFSNEYGEIDDRVIRIQVDIKTGPAAGDMFYLVPFGFSTTFLDSDTHNVTREPDMFYFSYIKRNETVENRLVSICIDATFHNEATADYEPKRRSLHEPASHCFLGKGDAEWVEVRKWSGAFLQAVESASAKTQGKGGNRQLLGFWHRSGHHTHSAAGERRGRQIGRGVGEKVGHKIGEKIGSRIGSEIGGEVGGAAGGAIGGAVAGPPGAVVGHEVGAWAGRKAGSKIGGEVGGKIGGEVGGKIGGEVGGDIGGAVRL